MRNSERGAGCFNDITPTRRTFEWRDRWWKIGRKMCHEYANECWVSEKKEKKRERGERERKREKERFCVPLVKSIAGINAERGVSVSVAPSSRRKSGPRSNRIRILIPVICQDKRPPRYPFLYPGFFPRGNFNSELFRKLGTFILIKVKLSILMTRGPTMVENREFSSSPTRQRAKFPAG